MDTHADLRQQQGATLRRLCQQGDAMLVRHMLRSGALVDAAQADGCTGLWLACEQGHAELVKLLCEHGANVHQLKQPGDVAPLYIAAQNGHTAVVELLLAHGALPNVTKSTGATPLYIAAQQNFVDIVMALIRAGAGVGIANHQGISPLAIACFQGNHDTVRVLLTSGADPSALCGGKSAVEWAHTNGHGQSIARIIEQHRDERVREQERRLGLGRGEDVTPFQELERQQILRQMGGTATPTRGGPTTDTASTSWYTPRYLQVSSSTLPAPNSSAPRGGGMSPVPSAIAHQRSPFRQAREAQHASGQHSHQRSIQNPSLQHVVPDTRHAVWHTFSGVLPGAVMAQPSGASGFSCGGALTPAALEDEARRNEAFRKQISKAPGSTLTTEASSARTRANLYAVDQEWAVFKDRLAHEEGALQESKTDVTNAWMYSYATVAQYENTLRGMRREQSTAMRRNQEKLEQDRQGKERNTFTYPPLVGEKVEVLRRFVAQGSSAKGPPPLPSDDATGEDSAAPADA